ncbi:MAG: TIR domain-containing protein [Sphingomonas sp.]
MSRVFLSYAREDAQAAKKLADAIAEAGHDVWWDRHIQGGSRFTNEIDRALKEAEAVVVLWSPASVQSAWVQDEAAEGRDSARLVPVALGSVKPPLGFRQFHTISVGSASDGEHLDGVEDLLKAIASTCASDARDGASEPVHAPEPQKKLSVCVLPFLNMSGEPEQEYFSDGISEDIITDLSNVSALSVVARNTAFTFKGQSLDVKDVAKGLGVTHVLEGSVRKAGNRVRITAQLIDGTAGDHVWAARYDRDLHDIFAIQDEISKAIVDALKIKLLPQEKKAIEQRGTSNAEAYNLYLMARQQWIQGSYGDLRRDKSIVRFCEQAISLDPQYAQAWALMGLAQLELRFFHGLDENALPAAERALEINPNLPEAHCIKARYLEEDGRAEEAEKQARTALELDPESWEGNRETARILFRSGHIRECIPFFEKAAALMETDWRNAAMLIGCYRATGDDHRARSAAKVAISRVEAVIAKDPTNCSAIAMGATALGVLGEEDRAREWIRRALMLDPENLLGRYNIACVLVSDLDDHDGAIEALTPYFERTSSTTEIRHVDADPDLDPLRSDPRFISMLAAAKVRLGLAPASAQ